MEKGASGAYRLKTIFNTFLLALIVVSAIGSSSAHNHNNNNNNNNNNNEEPIKDGGVSERWERKWQQQKQ